MKANPALTAIQQKILASTCPTCASETFFLFFSHVSSQRRCVKPSVYPVFVRSRSISPLTFLNKKLDIVEHSTALLAEEQSAPWVENLVVLFHVWECIIMVVFQESNKTKSVLNLSPC
jgi:hypothetical protein